MPYDSHRVRRELECRVRNGIWTATSCRTGDLSDDLELHRAALASLPQHRPWLDAQQLLDEVKEQLFMKNNKSGKPADGLTPEARHADNVKYNNQRSHLTAGDGLVPASENDGMTPEDRAASRAGTDYQRSSKAHNYNKAERSKISRSLATKICQRGQVSMPRWWGCLFRIHVIAEYVINLPHNPLCPLHSSRY
jgi:hypothetical protein